MSTKLEDLLAIEGFDNDLPGFLEAYVTDSVCPAICMTAGCDYTAELEPDQDAGYCENCRAGTMKSGLILAGLI